jgi:3-oxoacyl-[acyl-carrier-protein] synthase II
MELKRVVVTGLGSLTPLGNTTQEYWDGLLNGVSGADMITHFDASKFKTQFACELKNFSPGDFMDRKELRKVDLYTVYALVAAEEALQNSGIKDFPFNPDRVGVIWASGIGGLLTFYEEVRDFAKGDGTPRFSPFFIPKMIADIAAGHISIKYGLRGPNFTTTSACASSANSIIDAYNYIRLGKADVFVTGGSEAPINQPGVGGFNALHAISTRNDDPKSASRPFDKDRDGFVLGEGAGAIILEEMEHALARGANIICEIGGAGLSADAHHITSPHPDGYGAMMCMKNALDDAGLTIYDVDHINTHGTSTPVGDIVEPKAIVSLFGEQAYKIHINSTKSMTGHLLGAAGAVESIAAILAVHHDMIPPTINFGAIDEEIDPKLNFSFGSKGFAHKVDVALSNTFGFGGHNAAIIFKKFVK